jgi:undecaprenyl-diphosphatase
MITYLQAIILGLFQGVTELFPVSSLGHSVLIAYLFNWHNVLNGTVNKSSSFLLFLVVIHVATALALLFYYRRTWYRIIKAWLGSLASRSIESKDAKLAWLLIFATIPAALTGLIFQTILQKQFAKPLSAIIFIIINGMILLAGDIYINRYSGSKYSLKRSNNDKNIGDNLTFKRAAIIGVSQIAALIAGISRSGITMIGGVFSGLDRDQAAEFSFLLATPVILGAGLYKLPTVLSSKSAGMHGEMLVGAVCAAIAAYFSVRFLDRYFKKSSFRPFGIYCMSVGVIMLIIGLARGGLV